MIGIDVNHCQVISNSLKEVHEIDDQTIASLCTLQERLDCLKRKSPLFADISFSPHVKVLMSHRETAVVG
jgi:hypothetical protein